MRVQAMKVAKRVFEQKIQKTVEISEIQMGYMTGRDTIDAIFAVRQLIAKYRKAGEGL